VLKAGKFSAGCKLGIKKVIALKIVKTPPSSQFQKESNAASRNSLQFIIPFYPILIV